MDMWCDELPQSCRMPPYILPSPPRLSVSSFILLPHSVSRSIAKGDVQPRFTGLGFRLGGPQLGPTVQQILQVGWQKGDPTAQQMWKNCTGGVCKFQSCCTAPPSQMPITGAFN